MFILIHMNHVYALVHIITICNDMIVRIYENYISTRSNINYTNFLPRVRSAWIRGQNKWFSNPACYKASLGSPSKIILIYFDLTSIIETNISNNVLFHLLIWKYRLCFIFWHILKSIHRLLCRLHFITHALLLLNMRCLKHKSRSTFISEIVNVAYIQWKQSMMKKNV